MKMETNELIKALRYCQDWSCKDCPLKMLEDYEDMGVYECESNLMKVAIEHLEQLEKELESVKAERNAAVKDIKDLLTDDIMHECEICKHYKNCRRNTAECEREAEWRGVRKDGEQYDKS